MFLIFCLLDKHLRGASFVLGSFLSQQSPSVQVWVIFWGGGSFPTGKGRFPAGRRWVRSWKGGCRPIYPFSF